VLRHLVIGREAAVTEASLILKSKDEKPERRRRDDEAEGETAGAERASEEAN
jgi:small subunit ribosomal protein S6